MFLQNLRAKVGARLSGDRESGFTLIELLVVMLILGILAAIALPAFFNQKDKAGDAKAKEYVHSAQVAMETYFTDNATYVGATVPKLEAIEPTLSSAEFANEGEGGALEPAPGADSYTITIEGSKATQEFSVKNAAGTITFPCVAVGVGGCPSDGFWD
ncbi:MAG: type II secretion system protein [Solirubrobacterales bacterium]